MKEVLVRLDRCMGCRNCQLACAVEHSASRSLFGAIAEEEKPRYRIYVERGDGMNVPLTCRHCEPAPCIEACVAGALRRDERGAVVQVPERCVGCWTCIMVCPYGVVGRQVEQRVATKCDRCPDRDVPACVSSCPTKALVYAEAGEFGATVRKSLAGVVAKAVATGAERAD